PSVRTCRGRIYPTRNNGRHKCRPYNTLKREVLCNLIKKRPIKVKREEPLRIEISTFLESVKKRKPPLISGREGREALEVALKIEREMRK
ncbi:MAG: hypothetical protein KAX20_02300, partial [Candidatus Omnitrophica bacterium]|nr:hypothetical protein [Candidatus Omnitrophota bacterium]